MDALELPANVRRHCHAPHPRPLILPVALLTRSGELAEAWGIRDRGTLEVGKAADLVHFDPTAVSVGPEYFVNDFPGEANRYLRPSKGYHHVVVNGQVVREGDAYTDARGGDIV